MKQIRKGVFETNSSSTHSICIAKNVELTIAESLHFEFGEFGWEYDTLHSVRQKASYLYTGLIGNNRKEDADRIIELLRDRGIEVTAEEPTYKKYSSGDMYVTNGGYVDHSYNLQDFLDAVCKDEDKLMNYLFSDLSYIITGNDNAEDDVDINVTYDHDEYYKGN